MNEMFIFIIKAEFTVSLMNLSLSLSLLIIEKYFIDIINLDLTLKSES